jgi:glycosyltransferase involved in cell wall biosynthesis
MNVLLDLNVLGRGIGAEVSRTGIFRATESLLRALLPREDLTLFFAAEASWVSELLLLSYARERGRPLEGRILRTWEQPGGTEAEAEEEAAALIAHILAEKAAGREARRERASLTLLNAQARRLPLPVSFDVVHSLRTALPPRTRVPARARALTVHDVIPLLHPEWMYEGAEAEFRMITDSLAIESDYVIANSETTARDVSALLGIAPDRVFVTPFAANPEIFHPEDDPAKLAEVRARYGIPPGNYVLSVCTVEPRKNLPHLIRCFFRLLDQEDPGDLYLVLVGPSGWKTDAVSATLAQRPELRAHVVLTGYVADSDLAAVYSGARAFVYPSLYEGFGLPILEAMQCGTPVVTSNTSSMPEVSGTAAVQVSPTDSDALCEALKHLLADADHARELRRRGLARASLFSWDRTAERTVAAYRAMLAPD